MRLLMTSPADRLTLRATVSIMDVFSRWGGALEMEKD